MEQLNMSQINETHDIHLISWVDSANDNSEFPVQNLPLGIFRRAGSGEVLRGGVAIGDQVLDIAGAVRTGIFDGLALQAAQAAAESSLNRLMGMGSAASGALRLALSRALRSDSEVRAQIQECLVPQADVEYGMPSRVGDYTDFYTSINHASAVGALFRPDNPLLPNYKWIPIAYHGRSSTIGISGTAFARPMAQIKAVSSNEPDFGPSRRLDYEVEVGVFIGEGSEAGDRIGIDVAEDHIFGLCLLNDWSARDIQAWEYQPLGPFLAKNFATTISPWIVTREALAPFRTKFSRPKGDPQPLSYLASHINSEQGAIDLQLECYIQTENMRAAGEKPVKLSSACFSEAYWTVGQMVAHHSVNGCAMNPGDLLGTGTQSGANRDQSGSLLELTRGGTDAIRLPNGESRNFLEDGDSVLIRGFCEREGAARIGFGEVEATILPAQD